MQKLRNVFLSAALFLNVMLLLLWAFDSRVMDLPAWLKVAGRLHPMILHFPVALLLVVCLLEIIKSKETDLILFLLSITAISASLAALFGFFLLHGGDYETSNDLYWHKITGIITALVSGLLAWLRERKILIYRGSLICGSLLLIVAGHLGSTVTHGKDFITGPLQNSNRKITDINEAIVFRDIIQPIFDEKCIGCHNPEKRKGALLLTGFDELLKGGENGAVFIAGKPDSSALYKLLMLPPGDDMHMPPEGKPQPEKDEIALIRWWIANGADAKQKYAEAKVPDSINKIVSAKFAVGSPLDALNIKPADSKILVGLSNNDRVIRQQAIDQPYISVFMANRKKIGEKELEEISVIREQVTSMDLSNSLLTQKQFREIANFPHLRMLHLENSNLSDTSLKFLENLAYLEYLNISNTAISSSATKIAGNFKSLKKLYLYETPVDNKSLVSLRKSKPGIIIGITPDLSGDSAFAGRLTDPAVTIDSAVFTRQAMVDISYRLKNVELRYTFNGKDPDSSSSLYKEPLVIKDTGVLKVIATRSGWKPSRVLSFRFHKQNLKFENAKLDERPDKRYESKLDSSLVDLVHGSNDHGDGNYLGYYGNDLNASLSFSAPTTISSVTVSSLVRHNAMILAPSVLELWQSSSDGKPIKRLAVLRIPEQKFNPDARKIRFRLKFPQQTLQYLRIKIVNPGKTPMSHESKGAKSWIFIDEIIPG